MTRFVQNKPEKFRVPPIYEKFSDQVPNWTKVVPWQKGQNEPLIN